MHSVELTPENLKKYDAVVVVTNHKGFDYAAIAQHAKLVVDTRNAMAAHADGMGARLVKA
jgi:UDP-N-acetyl-D-glucosamine dehydrogenase